MSSHSTYRQKIRHRLQHARPGSILILVLAVLILLALMGTAYIATARTDRYAAVQFVNATREDDILNNLLLTETSVVQKAIVAGLYDSQNTANTKSYRKVNSANTTNAYYHYDGAGWYNNSVTTNVFRRGDRWLGPSVPMDLNFALTNTAKATPGSTPYLPPNFMVPAFKALSIPPNAYESNDISAVDHDMPFVDPFTGASWGLKSTDWAVPTYKTASYAGNTSSPLPSQWVSRVRQYPAMRVADYSQGGGPGPILAPDAATAATNGQFVVGADASGQGICDSGITPFLLSPNDGETYTYSVRVIDNAALINPNVAWSPAYDVDFGSNFQMNCFPTSVALLENMLPGGTELANINTYGKLGAYNPPLISDLSTTYSKGWFSYNANHTWGRFASQCDQMYMSLGRRLSNPASSTGTNYMGGCLAINTPTKVRAYDWSDSSILAYRAGYANINLGGSRLDRDAFGAPNSPLYPPSAQGFDSFYQSAINYTFNRANAWNFLTPSEVFYWFDYYYNYDGYNAIAAAPAPVTPPWTGAAPPDGNIKPRTVGNAQLNFANGVFRPLRPLTTANNPVNSILPAKIQLPPCVIASNMGIVGSGTSPINPIGVPSAQTSDFFALWRGYWCMMTDENGHAKPSTVGNFSSRSDLVRNSKITPSPDQVVMLRAAIAAANTIGQREVDPRPREYNIQIGADGANVGFGTYVYSMKRQPFITQVIADGGESKPGTNYVAVVLYNPYPSHQTGDADGTTTTTQFGIDIRSWAFETVDRTTMTEKLIEHALPDPVTPTAGTPPFHSFEPGGTNTKVLWTAAYVPWKNVNTANPSLNPNPIPWLPYIVVESNKADRPANITIPAGVPVFQLPLLADSIGKELFLLRPATFDDGTWISQGLAGTCQPIAPVDSVDMTGWKDKATAVLPGQHKQYIYARPNDEATWYCSCAGGYPQIGADVGAKQGHSLDPTLAANKVVLATPSAILPNTQLNGPASQWWSNPWVPNGTPGGARRIDNGAAVDAFPFGGFARPGDLLQVPYFGSYRIYNTTGPSVGSLIDLNAPPVDLYFSESKSYMDTAPFPNPNPIAIGRPTPQYNATTAITYDPKLDPHGWAFNFFDYLTVLNNPDSAYAPNINPTSYYWVSYTASSATAAAFPKRNYFAKVAIPVPTSTNPPLARGNEGLINVNTASWKVLSMVQMIPPGASDSANPPATPQQLNQDLAKAIVYYRDIDDGTGGVDGAGKKIRRPHGPFKTLLELNGVYDVQHGDLLHAFQNGWNTLTTPTPTVPPAWAEFNTDSFIQKYSTPYLMLDRVSNILTTRSDCFTAYIVVQGWRNFGSASAEMVSQKRTAFQVDRTGVLPGGLTSPSINSVPTE